MPGLEVERIFVIMRALGAIAGVVIVDPAAGRPGHGLARRQWRQGREARRIGAAALGSEADNAERVVAALGRGVVQARVEAVAIVILGDRLVGTSAEQPGDRVEGGGVHRDPVARPGLQMDRVIVVMRAGAARIVVGDLPGDRPRLLRHRRRSHEGERHRGHRSSPEFPH